MTARTDMATMSHDKHMKHAAMIYKTHYTTLHYSPTHLYCIIVAGTQEAINFVLISFDF